MCLRHQIFNIRSILNEYNVYFLFDAANGKKVWYYTIQLYKSPQFYMNIRGPELRDPTVESSLSVNSSSLSLWAE